MAQQTNFVKLSSIMQIEIIKFLIGQDYFRI